MLQWLTEDLEQRLQTVVAALIPGARLRHTPGAAPPGLEAEWMWWQQPFGVAPDAMLVLGLPAVATSELFSIVRQSGLLSAAPGGDGSHAVLRILSNACATIAPEPCGGAGLLVSPPDGVSAMFALDLATGAHHSLAVLLTPALIAAIEAASQDDLPEADPVLLNLNLPVSISLGRARLEFRELLRLSTGSVVELDRMLAEAVDVTINDSVIARGEIVVVEGNYGVRIQSVSGAACRSFAGFQRSR